MKTGFTKNAGIYKLICPNGKIYIGKAVNLNKRLNRHKNSGKDLKSRSFLGNAIKKYGWDTFTVEILEIVENFDKLKDNQALLDREAYYIEFFDTTDRSKGYNLCKFSNDSTGIPIPEEIRLRMRGPRHTEESKRKISEATLGRKHSEESKEKMRKPKSKEHAANISKAMIGKPNLAWIGRKMSEEQKQKMRDTKAKQKNNL